MKAFCTRVAARFGALVGALGRRIRTNASELATAAAMIAGWLLVTRGIAARCAPAVVWPISLGLLCCSLGGWQLLFTVARYGLYALHKDKGP